MTPRKKRNKRKVRNKFKKGALSIGVSRERVRRKGAKVLAGKGEVRPLCDYEFFPTIKICEIFFR